MKPYSMFPKGAGNNLIQSRRVVSHGKAIMQYTLKPPALPAYVMPYRPPSREISTAIKYAGKQGFNRIAAVLAVTASQADATFQACTHDGGRVFRHPIKRKCAYEARMNANPGRDATGFPIRDRSKGMADRAGKTVRQGRKGGLKFIPAGKGYKRFGP